MNEFTVTLAKPAQITGNFDEMRAALQNMMQAYAGLDVTEENIQERKKDVATLRKMNKAIDDKRKEVKAEYNKPFTAFEKECKSLTEIINTEINRINEGLSEFEQRRVKEKQEHIRQLYEEHIGEYASFLPLNRIKNPKWDNKTCSDNDIIADIQEERVQVESDLRLIRQQCGEFTDDCINAYKIGNNSLNAAFQRKTDLESARQRAEQVVREASEPVVQEHPIIPEPIVGEAAKIESFRFTVYSALDAESVRSYMKMFDIEFTEG